MKTTKSNKNKNIFIWIITFVAVLLSYMDLTILETGKGKDVSAFVSEEESFIP